VQQASNATTAASAAEDAMAWVVNNMLLAQLAATNKQCCNDFQPT
jgi:hypothetical protein